jgi:hypothetical protein
MGNPIILYNSRTITMPLERALANIDVQPIPPRTIRVTETGSTQVESLPRMDIAVTFKWWPITEQTEDDPATLRWQLENFVQWAFNGGIFGIALDSGKIVDTQLSGGAVAGASTLAVADATGIVDGQIYKLTSGPYYQLVKVDSHVSTTINLTQSIDFPMPVSATFRDQYYFLGLIRDAGARHPIRVLPAPPDKFEFILQFHEFF